ncbi:hypothetical protein GCM10023321_06040 [Pseudonocardia eucalypti]|uniref:Alpha/beta hydrolase n=1 Tax=Pseudonocardia eucalypti TaxID=648755 RepID=A0ABP9PJK9_9PSEU|nr:hypothetical protein [Pseudonocardia eucalypti]
MPAHNADLARRRESADADLLAEPMEQGAAAGGPPALPGVPSVPAPRQSPDVEPELFSHPVYRSSQQRAGSGPATETWGPATEARKSAAGTRGAAPTPPTASRSVPAPRAEWTPGAAGRHAKPGRRRRTAVEAKEPGWRRIALTALAVVVAVLLGYGGIVAFQSRPASEEQAAPAPAPAAPAAPAPAPADPLKPPAAQAPAPQAAAPTPRTGTPPAGMLARTGQRSGNADKLTLPAGGTLTVYDNFPMAGAPAVTRAVVVVHGTGRNAEAYYQRALAAAKTAGVGDRTMVVSPWFKGDKDDKVSSGEASWTNDAWKQGYPAQSSGGVSSFTAMDNIMATLADKKRFPKLTHITLTGHSAGGQFTQRYAAFGKAPNVLNWVDFNFAVMNPSSYVYFDAARPGKNGAFSVPSGSSCQEYNQYKYGLDGRQSYPAQLSASAAMAQYASRQVTVFTGGADTVDNGDLDTDCGAMLQGANRMVRGQNFVNHFKALKPGAPHKFVVVPGVDHDGEAMLGSPLARTALFGASGSSS